MDEDGKNISDDMSSLLHAAEEWANERLHDINSSDNLDDSISYPAYMPIEEVARQVGLELCKFYNWNPETGTDSRLPRQNAGDTSFVQQSSEESVSHNIQSDSIDPPFTEMSTTATSKIEYHPQDALPITESLTTAKYDNAIKKTFIVRRNASFLKLNQSNTAHQIIRNKTFVVRRNVSRDILKQLNASNQLTHGMNKTYTLRNAPFKVMEDLEPFDEITSESAAKQKVTTVPEKLTVLSVNKPDVSLAEDVSRGSESMVVYNAEQKACNSSNGSYSKNFDKDELSNSKEHFGNAGKQKFHSKAPKILAVNTTLPGTLSYGMVDHCQFSDSDLITKIPHIECTVEVREMSGIFAESKSESKTDFRNDVFISRERENSADPLCQTKSNNAVANNKMAITSETTAGISTFIANEVIQSTPRKVPINNADMPNSTKAPQDSRTAVIAANKLLQSSHHSVKKVEISPTISSMKVNTSRKDSSSLSKENRAVIIKLDGKLKRLQMIKNPSQAIIQKFGKNHSLISPMTVKLPQERLLNSNPAAENFHTIAMATSPKTGNIIQTKSYTYPPDNKKCANLKGKTDIKNVPQKQLNIETENTEKCMNVIRQHLTANSQSKITECYLGTQSDMNKFQMMMKSNIFLPRNDLYFKDMIGKEFSKKAIQTGHGKENEPNNNLYNKFNNFNNQKLPISSGKEKNNTFGNTSFNTSQPIMNTTDTGITPIIGKRSYLDEPIKFFNYMSSPIQRRKSYPFAPRNMLSFNGSKKSITQSTTLPRTTREVIQKTPTKTKKTPVVKSNIKQILNKTYSTRLKNPVKRSHELPLENRASRLKAEYLAKKRAEKEFAEKSKMIEDKNLTPIMAGRLSVLRKKLPSASESVVKWNGAGKSNLSLNLNANNQFSIYGRHTISSISEVPQITNGREESMKTFQTKNYFLNQFFK